MLNQDFDNYRVVLSSCLNDTQTRQIVHGKFGNTISYNLIDDKLPIPVTFNHTVLKSVENFGQFDGYMYVESGLDFENNTTILQELYECMKCGPHSIVAGQVDTDNGYKEHNLNIQNNQGFFVVPPGKALNGHLITFSNQILQFYNRCWNDIYASHCNESTWIYVAAALKTNFVLCTKSIIHHIEHMDGPSSGFDVLGWVMSGRQTYEHPFIIPSILERVCTKYNHKYGLGYEEARGIFMHDPSCFDEQGFCTNDKLKEICKKVLFLQPEEFDYDKVKHTYIK